MNDTRPIEEIPCMIERIVTYLDRLQEVGLTPPKRVRMTSEEWETVYSDYFRGEPSISGSVPRRICGVAIVLCSSEVIERDGRFEE